MVATFVPNKCFSIWLGWGSIRWSCGYWSCRSQTSQKKIIMEWQTQTAAVVVLEFEVWLSLALGFEVHLEASPENDTRQMDIQQSGCSGWGCNTGCNTLTHVWRFGCSFSFPRATLASQLRNRPERCRRPCEKCLWGVQVLDRSLNPPTRDKLETRDYFIH